MKRVWLVGALAAGLLASRPRRLGSSSRRRSPSSIFKGEQIVAAPNAAGLDLATLGNHEFDSRSDVLIQRVAEARWQWVVSNVIDTNAGKPAGNAAPYLVRTLGSLKAGFIGLCLTGDEISADRTAHPSISIFDFRRSPE